MFQHHIECMGEESERTGILRKHGNDGAESLHGADNIIKIKTHIECLDGKPIE